MKESGTDRTDRNTGRGSTGTFVRYSYHQPGHSTSTVYLAVTHAVLTLKVHKTVPAAVPFAVRVWGPGSRRARPVRAVATTGCGAPCRRASAPEGGGHAQAGRVRGPPLPGAPSGAQVPSSLPQPKRADGGSRPRGARRPGAQASLLRRRGRGRPGQEMNFLLGRPGRPGSPNPPPGGGGRRARAGSSCGRGRAGASAAPPPATRGQQTTQPPPPASPLPLMASSSTSKVRSAFGGMTPPAPALP